MPKVEVVGLDAEFRDLYCSDNHPRDRLERARPLLDISRGPLSVFDAALRAKDDDGFSVQRAVRLEGYEVRAMQQGWGLFNPTRKVELTRWAYGEFDAASVEARIVELVKQVAEVVALPSVVHVGLFPADPANHNLMVHCGGVSASGEHAGTVMLELWPDAGNLARLESLVARCLLMGAYWSRYAGRPATLAQHLEAEGNVTRALVDHGWIAEDWLSVPWGVAVSAPLEHGATLDRIATQYGLSSYKEMRTNIYGNMLDSSEFQEKEQSATAHTLSIPRVEELSSDDLDYTRTVLSDSVLLGDARATTVACALYGDPAVRRYGHAGLGLSRWSGLEAAFAAVSD